MSSGASGSLLENQCALVEFVLQEPPDQILSILQTRVVVDDGDLNYADGILDLDGAIEILDQSGHVKVQEDKECVKRKCTKRESFSREFRGKKELVAKGSRRGDSKRQ